MRVKMFVIDHWMDGKWVPQFLEKGLFKRILWTGREARPDRDIRVRRVKTPAELDQYHHLDIIGSIKRTEWVN
jgi:hypothetical protein